MPVNFFSEDIDFLPENQATLIQWIGKISHQFSQSLIELNYIFCSDEHLLTINQQYLDHNYYTDIITFDNSEENNQIEGDIFISVNRVEENAKDLKQTFEGELHRVMAHGILHLIGFHDKTDAEKKVMREKENACLSLLQNI